MGKAYAEGRQAKPAWEEGRRHSLRPVERGGGMGGISLILAITKNPLPMALETLTGKWTGKYVYGESYGFPIAGTTVRFEMELLHNGYRVTGTCTDDEH